MHVVTQELLEIARLRQPPGHQPNLPRRVLERVERRWAAVLSHQAFLLAIPASADGNSNSKLGQGVRPACPSHQGFDERGRERREVNVSPRLRRTMSDSAKRDLVNALSALIQERRSCAQLLSKPYERGTYEATMARFVEFQAAIEAVERALVSEADYP